MNKSLIIILLFLLSYSPVDGQILRVKSIELSHVIVKIEKIHFEGEGEGPSISFELCFENNKDSLITLHPSQSKFFVQFRYKNKVYNNVANSFFLVPYFERKNVEIQPKESFFVNFGEKILLGTDILNNQNRKVYDYTLEMLQILPTLQVVYKEDEIKIISKEIENVKLSDYYNYTPR